MKTMRNEKLPAILIALAAAALACSLGGATGGDGGEDSAQPAGGEPAAPVMDIAGVSEVELLTPTEGAGIKPLFAWEAVDGAGRYLLILRDTDGATYWSWTGAATSIYLGGVSEQPAEDAAGPRLEAGMAWAVFALDGEGEVIASSALRAIAP